jgi:hypothetical protein
MLSIIKAILSKDGAMAVLGVFFVVIAVICYIVFLQGRIEKLTEELDSLDAIRTQERFIYNNEREKANRTIYELNKSINEFLLSKDSYEETINEKEKELIALRVKTQEDILDALETDNSVDNQHKIMQTILEEFSK